jgi:hypothetical protein
MPFLVSNTGSSFVLVGLCYTEGPSIGEPAARARRGEVLAEGKKIF